MFISFLLIFIHFIKLNKYRKIKNYHLNSLKINIISTFAYQNIDNQGIIIHINLLIYF
jgi:hypothetical protein